MSFTGLSWVMISVEICEKKQMTRNSPFQTLGQGIWFNSKVVEVRGGKRRPTQSARTAYNRWLRRIQPLTFKCISEPITHNSMHKKAKSYEKSRQRFSVETDNIFKVQVECKKKFVYITENYEIITCFNQLGNKSWEEANE